MEWTVAIGVDTHRDQHVAVALDRLGQQLGSLEIAVDDQGFAVLVQFARSVGEPAFAIEGTGSYGASLARALLSEGFPVFEVERPRRRRRNEKNDLIDAELAARRLLTGERLPLPRTGIEREQLRLLLVERRSAQHARQQAVNQLKAAIVTLEPRLRTRLVQRKPGSLAHSCLLRSQQHAPLRRLATNSPTSTASSRNSPAHSALACSTSPASARSAPPRSSSRPRTRTGSAASPPLPPSPASARSRPRADTTNATASTAAATANSTGHST